MGRIRHGDIWCAGMYLRVPKPKEVPAPLTKAEKVANKKVSEMDKERLATNPDIQEVERRVIRSVTSFQCW